MAAFVTLMEASEDAENGGLLKARMLFSRLFAAHLNAEHEVLGRATLANPRVIPVVQNYRERIGKLRHDYSCHVQRWTPAEIRTNRASYRLAVLGLQARLRETMIWEEKHLPL